MDEQFLLIQGKIEAVLIRLREIDDPKSRKTYLLEFRLLLHEADRLQLSTKDNELLKGYWRRYPGDSASIP